MLLKATPKIQANNQNANSLIGDLCHECFQREQKCIELIRQQKMRHVLFFDKGNKTYSNKTIME